MATLTITNLSSAPVLLQELYTTLLPGKTLVTERFRDDLHSHPRIQALWDAGTIDVSVVSEVSEDEFIDEKLHLFQGERGASVATTRGFHQPTITPAHGTNAPGQQPDIVVLGALVVAEMTLNTDSAYRVFKIPGSFVSDPAFHIHWTKSVDSDESTLAVRWRLNYTVFDGASGDVSGAPSTLEFEDTYDDSGTATRIVHRTADLPAVGFVAGYYVGLLVEAITPIGTPLVGEPALVTVDMTFQEYINQ